MVALTVSELDWQEGGVPAQPTPTESVLRRCSRGTRAHRDSIDAFPPTEAHS